MAQSQEHDRAAIIADLRRANADLQAERNKALAEKAALAEVLAVINPSRGDPQPVFDAILEKAHALCGAAGGSLTLWEGSLMRVVAMHNLPPELTAYLNRPMPAGPLNRVLIDGQRYVQYPDIREVDWQNEHVILRDMVQFADVRTRLMVPLRKDGMLLGFLSAHRTEVRLFGEEEIVLLENFASQAVIAMENARLITEQREALERQTAMAEVLTVINASPGDPQPVFDALLERAMRLCGAQFGSLYTYDGMRYQSAAQRGVPEAYAAFRAARPPDGTARAEATRTRETRQTVQILDMSQEQSYLDGHPGIRGMVDLGGARTVLAVPLLKDDTYIGYVSIYRQEVRPFADKQITLLENFAAQAVIAMENARMITEQREALERQTATAEVLGVINTNSGDLAPVFDTILKKAHQVCGAEQGSLQLLEGGQIRAVAVRGLNDEFAAFVKSPRQPNSSGPLAMSLERTVQVEDMRTLADAMPEDATLRTIVEVAGVRTWLALPLRRENVVLGRIVAARRTVRPFTEKQIALLEHFAAQAVIAMENARLITETREALERQTATAEVLQVINANPGDLAPVFRALLDRALHLCGATFGEIGTLDGDTFTSVAVAGMSDAFSQQRIGVQQKPGQGTSTWHLLQGENTVQIANLKDTDAYRNGEPARRHLVDVGGACAMLWVALRKDAALLGQIGVFRNTPGQFSDRQVALLENFAAQAVIAMENARLITETREALEQQTATAEVLGVINAHPGDLRPVFEAMLDKAMALCDAAFGELHLFDGERFVPEALRRVPPALEAYQRKHGTRGGPGTTTYRVIAGEDVVHIHDATEEDAYRRGDPARRARVDLGGVRSQVSIALRKDGNLLGMIRMFRQVVKPFDARQIALLRNFAAQAVIAMENARLITEQREALERQTATAEVLGVINANPGNLEPVFNAILEKAHTLCGATAGVLATYEDGQFHALATHGLPDKVDAVLRNPIPPTERQHALLRGERLVQVLDIRVNTSANANPWTAVVIAHSDARTCLWLPLRKDGALLGFISAYRSEVRPFSEREIALLENFAAQAVIAMENARLLGELRERTEALALRNSEYGERIEQQAATIDVLKAMSASPGDPQPVFDLIADRAKAFCEAEVSGVGVMEGDMLVARAYRGISGDSAREYEANFNKPPNRGTMLGRAVLEGRAVQSADLAGDAEYGMKQGAARAGLNAAAAVPMLRAGVPIGAIALSRRKGGGYSAAQMDLLQTFAEQAVIAITSAETYRELQERTEALALRNTEYGERIEQQSATIDVLKVMSASPGDPQPVFDLIAERARIFCHAYSAALMQVRGGQLHLRALTGHPAHNADAFKALFPRPVDDSTLAGRAVLTGHMMEIPDVYADDHFILRGASRDSGLRALMAVPMLRGTEAIGGITIGRTSVGSFSPTQIELLRTFAEQAVIAISSAENHRTLQARTDELTRSVAELQALEETIRAVNSSLDLDVVLATIISRAVRLSQADEGTIYEYDQVEDVFVPKAAYGMTAERLEALRNRRVRMGETHLGRSARERRAVHVSDVQLDRTLAGDIVDFLQGIHAVLAVPLLRDDTVIGGLVIRRRTAGDFGPSIPTLLQTFAGQSVLAIENARLFEQLTARGEEARRARVAAEAALEDLRRTQDRLVQTEKMASLGQLTAGIAHEIKNPLNFVNNFSDLSGELLDELNQSLAGAEAHLDQKTRADIAELSDMLKGNLQKIAEHGRRADSIVRNMLAHSRTGTSERRSVDLNALAEEALNLAYHGARAEFPGFNITMEKDLAPDIGPVELYPQEFTRVLLNLFGNGFYATRKRAEAAEAPYDPTLRLTTRDLGDRVEITVRDNGTGIPAAVREKIFEPFFTTKPAGEGTGLGLSLSYDIIAQQHGGQLTVDSEPGNFTEFKIILPRRPPGTPTGRGGAT